MAKKKRQHIPEFKKTSYRDASEGWPYPFKSLSECVLEMYPAADSESLEEWHRETGEETNPEPILFMAMVCGVVFRISQPDVRKALEDLWKWLTGGIHHRMDEDLANILIEVLTPQMARVIEARGYKRGWPKGEYISKKGRPPVSKGAWVAAFLAERYLRNVGMKATPAKEQAAYLAAVLLGREYIEMSEYYRYRKNAPNSNITELTRILTEEYNHWVKQDKLRLRPDGEGRHASLYNLLPYIGCEGICRATLGRIPIDLWQPFWDIKPAKTKNE